MGVRGSAAAIASALLIVTGSPAWAASPHSSEPPHSGGAPHPGQALPAELPPPVAERYTDDQALPAGVNDGECTSSQHPTPVVLVHGLTGSAGTNWAGMAPKLLDEGYCVFALTYGVPLGLPPLAGGFGPIEDSAVELQEFVDRVLAETGAEQVDLVGHSEGTFMPQYYLKFLGGAPNVRRYVAITPLYDGTTLHSASEILDRLAIEVPAVGGLADALCTACRQMFHDSDMVRRLSEGGVAVPGIEYTTIMSEFDQTVTPYTSGHLDSPDATNIVLQDVCPDDVSGHVGTVFNPAVARMVLNALDPEHPQPVEC